jgi:hypothetical protein
MKKPRKAPVIGEEGNFVWKNDEENTQLRVLQFNTGSKNN